MATPSIPPLRYQKGSHGSSPNKVANRPLSELSPMALRRNSPSFPQGKTSLFKSDSSPVGSSPFSANNASSPHLFWRGRDPASPSRENQSPHESAQPISPSKRSSIENLKKASRVKNSNIFAKEQQHLYDPAKTPTLLDGRPLSVHVPANAVAGRASDSFSPSRSPAQPFVQSESTEASLSPSKLNVSPAKSSLSKKTGANFRYSGFDPQSGIWQDEDEQDKTLPEGRGLHHFAKSVTFDQAPPQVNEYEMTTPVPSSVASGSREGSYDTLEDDEEELSFERGSSMDVDDSFDASLEDTDKTPVVLPEDWRFMSPDTANTELAQHEEDVFDDDVGSPAPSAHPGKMFQREHQLSVNSVDSNGQARPLPPLPPSGNAVSAGRRSHDSLSNTIERMSSSQRALPSPPQAPTISKSDLRSMSRDSLSIEDRLQLMMISKNKTQEQKVEADAQRERRLRRAESKDTCSDGGDVPNDTIDNSYTSNTTGPTVDLAPRLDRLSILKHLRSAHDSAASSVKDEDMNSNPSIYDPDIPIPSLEDPTQHHDREDDIVIKQEESDDDNGLYSIPDMYCRSSDGQSEVGDDETSQYSQSSIPASTAHMSEQDVETPRAQSPVNEPEKKTLLQDRMSLPDFMDFGDESSFDFGLSSYMTPPTDNADVEKPLPAPPADLSNLPDLAALRQSIQRPYTPEEQLEPPKLSFSGDESSAGPGTPNSVIRHPISISPESEITSEANTLEKVESVPQEVPISNKDDLQSDDASKELPTMPHEALTTAQSTVTDSSREHRVSSLVQLELSQESLDLGLGLDLEQDFDRVVESQKVAFELSLQRLYHPFHGRFPSGEAPAAKDGSAPVWLQDALTLSSTKGARTLLDKNPCPDYPLSPYIGNYANRSPLRQRGYLMRQNTKVVVASERGPLREELQLPPPVENEIPAPVSAEPNEVRPSSRKASQPTWTAEPWNSKSRRRSIRVGGEKAIPKRKPVDGPAPPLPGQQSNVQDNLGAVAEDEFAEEEAEELEDGVERGRLFVKVVGAKDLQLPLPKHERTSFALTLDNGLHCVTTAWLDLARDAPIGQEFELVVLNELEFQLTLQMKLEQPKVERAPSPSKPPSSPKKQGAFGRLFGSPKKRKESDQRLSQAQEASQRPVTPPSAYDLVQGLVAKDGSFARAYVSLSDHEKHSYGRPYQVDVKCFNEWAMEEVPVGSSRSKKSVSQLQQRPPYEIGKLQLQLLYVPKPKGAKDEDMPKSMNGAVRALKEAEETMKQQASVKEFEGYLSQQGGDCPYWRRRFFKLVGSKFTAYHESTLQPRATINLGKASKLIDDKSSLMQKETSTKGGGRRKSAFAEEEEGYMFVEEGFRIKFANGEVIDFYADSPAQKDEWMHVLSQVVGKSITSSSAPVKGWTEMVLKREKSMMAKSTAEMAAKKARKEIRLQEQSTTHTPSHATPSGIPIPLSASALPRPSGHMRTESYQPVGGSRSQAGSPVKAKLTASERREKAKSMAF